jgi:hypothetical protein
VKKATFRDAEVLRKNRAARRKASLTHDLKAKERAARGERHEQTERDLDAAIRKMSADLDLMQQQMQAIRDEARLAGYTTLAGLMEECQLVLGDFAVGDKAGCMVHLLEYMRRLKETPVTLGLAPLQEPAPERFEDAMRCEDCGSTNVRWVTTSKPMRGQGGTFVVETWWCRDCDYETKKRRAR